MVFLMFNFFCRRKFYEVIRYLFEVGLGIGIDLVVINI